MILSIKLHLATLNRSHAEAQYELGVTTAKKKEAEEKNEKLMSELASLRERLD